MKYKTLRHMLSFPFIWMIIVPIVFTDILLEIYHRICFPLYGIPIVTRSRYIRITDRGKLSYLSTLEKIHCLYCGYVNGWFHYASVIAGKTEHYWCAIMHLQGRGYIPTEEEKTFSKYGDEATLRKRYAMYDKEYFKE